MGTFSEAGRFMMFLDGLWVGRGRARPPAGLAACVGCNKASNRIWRRQGGRCFLINVDLLAARGIASCSLRRQPASSTFLWFRAFFRTCKHLTSCFAKSFLELETGSRSSFHFYENNYVLSRSRSSVRTRSC